MFECHQDKVPCSWPLPTIPSTSAPPSSLFLPSGEELPEVSWDISSVRPCCCSCWPSAFASLLPSVLSPETLSWAPRCLLAHRPYSLDASPSTEAPTTLHCPFSFSSFSRPHDLRSGPCLEPSSRNWSLWVCVCVRSRARVRDWTIKIKAQWDPTAWSVRSVTIPPWLEHGVFAKNSVDEEEGGADH